MKLAHTFARLGLATAVLLGVVSSSAATQAVGDSIEQEVKAIEGQMIAWRRQIHQNPELGNREVRTSSLVAAHLKKLGYEVRENVAHTGVVAVLKGGKPGPVVALRADMDALPVTEQVDLPFASKVKATWNGKETGVMHACGHDGHVAILMAAAEIFAKLRGELPGTVKLLFQPAEEGPPMGEEGGAQLMLKDGAFDSPAPEAVFGLHVTSLLPTGMISYRAGAVMAGSNTFRITVRGRQTHGAMPWLGVDPIVVGAQIVLALQTIESRQLDATREPSVLTIGAFNAGTRQNIIPAKAEMQGTLRTFDEGTRAFIMRRVTETAEAVAKSGGAEADVEWKADGIVPLVNNIPLTQRMVPTLKRVVGPGKIVEGPLVTASEDFAFFARQVPGFFFFVGVTMPDTSPMTAAPNHSPQFRLDEAGLIVGLRSMLHVTFDYLGGAAGK